MAMPRAISLSRRGAARAAEVAPGLLLSAAVAAAAYAALPVTHALGAPIVALIVGVAMNRVVGRRGRYGAGAACAAKTVLKAAIVVLGLSLNVSQIAHVGVTTLPVMLGSLAAALIAALTVGRLAAIPNRLQMLIGVGTGICGASAIGAVSAVVGAAEADVAYAIATIFVFNVAAIVVFPLLGHALALDNHAFGLWAGTAVNDTSSVVAVAYSYGASAGDYAVIVKLTRTTLIIPIVLVLSLVVARRRLVARGGEEAGLAAGLRRASATIPWFLVLFVLASVAETVIGIPQGNRHAMARVAAILITVALAGVGMTSRLDRIRSAGWRPLALGLCTWVAVAATSLAIAAATGDLG